MRRSVWVMALITPVRTSANEFRGSAAARRVGDVAVLSSTEVEVRVACVPVKEMMLLPPVSTIARPGQPLAAEAKCSRSIRL